MGRQNKPSNKERDSAIAQLYKTVEVLVKETQNLHQGVQFAVNRLDHYIDWRRDGKRYRRSVEKAVAKEKEKQDALRKDEQAHEQNLETSQADQG